MTFYAPVLTAVLTTGLLSALPASAQSLSAEQARQRVAAFYDMLNQPATKNIAVLAKRVLSPDWKSYASETDFKGREDFVKQVIGFGKLIPDLKWDIKDVLVDGDRIVVRSEASGTPVGPFFGAQPNGQTFRIMAIDIHTFKDGKAVTAHHVEDWARAVRQISAK